MKNERGFFTIVGLCLLLTVAILITGVQEFEANYSRGATNALLEAELKNAAESTLIKGITTNSDRLTEIIDSKKFGAITVDFQKRDREIFFNTDGYVQISIDTSNGSGKVFIAVASCDSNFMEGKVYRRVLAFTVNGDNTIHFVNDL